MNYKEFLDFIRTNNLLIKEIQDTLGYKNKSIINNWSKHDQIPEKALNAIKLYLELKKVKEENNRLKGKIGNNQNNKVSLSEISYKIAKQKSEQYDLSIEEYISSIIISSI